MGFESPDFYVFYFNLKWFESFRLRFSVVRQSPKTLSCQGFQSIKQPHQIRKSHRLVRIGWGHSFWSCWADSNCRPHPYQKVRVHFTLCPLVSLHPVRSPCHKDFCVIFSLAVLPCFRPFVGRFVGNPFSQSSPKLHPIRRSIAIPSNTSSNYTYFCQMNISIPLA